MEPHAAWPVVAGSYTVGDPQAPVAVCALTSERLVEPLAHLPGVAVAGKVYTANLGIERIILNITANPAIRFCLLCGKDSPLFRPGQSLVALADSGIDAQRQIIGAAGYEPVLPTLAPERVAQFRRQVEVVDWTGEENLRAIEQVISGLAARNPGRFATDEETISMAPQDDQFKMIRPGGQREPLQYDPKGYFVIALDREEEQIVVRHYLPDHTPAHEMRGRMAGSMLLGLLREGLVTQLSHAGYLGEELAKAQAALTLGLRYDQDRPLRPREAPPAQTESASQPMPQQGSGATSAAPPRMPRITPAATWAQLQAAPAGDEVDIVLAVTGMPSADLLDGTFLEGDEADFSAYRRTAHRFAIRWTPTIPIVMGTLADVQVGALVRARGHLDADRQLVEAERLVILTHAVRLIDA